MTATTPGLAAIVVSHQSIDTIDDCLTRLRDARCRLVAVAFEPVELGELPLQLGAHAGYGLESRERLCLLLGE